MQVARAFQPEICPLQLAACRLPLRGGGLCAVGVTRRRAGKRSGGCLVFGQAEASKAASDRLMRLQKGEQGLRQMPDGTHGRCQRSLRKVMTRKRLLVGGLTFRPEAAALDDHSLAMVLCRHCWS
ncbi:MAG: hypothetical protein RLZZ232_2268 [Planctomycetota bacterium]|jgi:hypothetical protein